MGNNPFEEDEQIRYYTAQNRCECGATVREHCEAFKEWGGCVSLCKYYNPREHDDEDSD